MTQYGISIGAILLVCAVSYAIHADAIETEYIAPVLTAYIDDATPPIIESWEMF